jgi:general secretion pathway protein I
MLTSARTSDRRDAGFTILEALVALAITGAVLASISSLVATGIRGTWSSESRLRSLQIARSVLANLPDRHLLKSEYQGWVDGAHWTLRSIPYQTARESESWSAMELLVSVNPVRGAPLTMRTVRLMPKERK